MMCAIAIQSNDVSHRRGLNVLSIVLLLFLFIVTTVVLLVISKYELVNIESHNNIIKRHKLFKKKHPQ